MAAAQEARWAKLKQGSEPPQTVSAKPKGKLSASAENALERQWEKMGIEEGRCQESGVPAERRRPVGRTSLRRNVTA
jgi:hypothetical protein